MYRLLETIHLLLGCHKWSAQARVVLKCATPFVCVQVGLPGLAVVDHTFIFLLALQLLQGAHDALHMTVWGLLGGFWPPHLFCLESYSCLDNFSCNPH